MLLQLNAGQCEGNFIDQLEKILKTQDSRVIRGDDNWLFLRTDLESYTKDISLSSNDDGVSPLDSIIDFYDQLKSKNIELIILPVPGKVSINYDKLISDDIVFTSKHQELYDSIRSHGITVIDLHAQLQLLKKDHIPTHLKYDTHWSQESVRLAAKEISKVIQGQAWYSLEKKKDWVIGHEEKKVLIGGDLLEMINENKPIPEELTLSKVKLNSSFLESDESSPVILMGDSHNIVFHRSAGLDAVPFSNGGLPDFLAANLQLPIDNIAVLGSGANASRAILARRRDNLAGKKCIVWVFSIREFTHSATGWKKIPVLK
jgi:hypothetical protein